MDKVILIISVAVSIALAFAYFADSGLFPRITGYLILEDWSGLGNNGNFKGEVFNDGLLNPSCPNCPQIVAGKYGSALKFDGIDDSISIPNDASTNFGTGDFTLSAWVMTTSATDGAIIETSTGAGIYTALKALRIENSGKNIGFYVRSSGGSPDLSVNVNLNDGIWHHVVGTYAANVRKLYFDGVLVGSDTSSIGNTDTTQPWRIGSALDGTVDLTGSIDEVRIYNRALTQQEILEDMNSTHPISRPIASYSFEKIENNTVLDTHTIVKGKYGAGVSLAGNDYIEFPDAASLNPPQGLTVEAWIKVAGFTGQHFIFSKRSEAAGNDGYQLNVFDNRLGMLIDGPAAQGIAVSNPTLKLNTWHHVASTWNSNNGTVRVYIDGIQDGTTGTATGSIATTRRLWIGAENGPINFFNGTIDEVRIYNRTLTSQEIKESYQNNKIYPDNVLYLSFDNTGKPSPDVSTAPDVTVSDVTFSSTEAGNTTFDVVVKNIGTATANGYKYNVDFGDGMSTGNVGRLTQLASGQSETLIFGPDLYTSAGSYQLRVQVNTSGDSNITNNVFTKIISIFPTQINITNQTNQTMPDLIVSDVTSFRFNSSAININATISNTGNVAANNFYVEFRHLVHTNTFIGEKFISSLSPDSKITVTQQWNVTNENNGTHTIRIRADPKVDVNESNEHNNDRKINITISIVNQVLVDSISQTLAQTTTEITNATQNITQNVTNDTIVSTAKQITTEDLINAALNLDTLKITYQQMQSKVIAISDYYASVGDTTNEIRYREVGILFQDLYSKIDSLKTVLKTSSSETLQSAFSKGLGEVEISLRGILNKLLEEPTLVDTIKYFTNALVKKTATAPLVDIAIARKQKLLALMENEPDEFLRLIIPASQRINLPSDVQPYLEKDFIKEGVLEVYHKDWPDHSITQYTLVADEQSYNLYFTSPIPLLSSDNRVQIKGVELENNVVLNPEDLTNSPSQNDLASQIEWRTIVILFDFQDVRTSITAAGINKFFFDTNLSAESINPYFQEVSYRKMGVVGEVRNYTLPRNMPVVDCPTDSIMPAVYNGGIYREVFLAALNDSVNFTNYDQIVFMHPRFAACSYSGSSIVGKVSFRIRNDNTQINIAIMETNSDNPSLLVAAHEMGHSLGLGHGDGVECVSNVFCTLTFNSWVPYGDLFTVMGNTAHGHPAAGMKTYLGWLNPTNVLTMNISSGRESGAYIIKPLENLTEGYHAIAILGQSFSYIIEYRQPIGFDRVLDPNAFNGVLIHDFGGNLLFDTTPGSIANRRVDFLDAALSINNTLVDPDGTAIHVFNSSLGLVVEVRGSRSVMGDGNRDCIVDYKDLADFFIPVVGNETVITYDPNFDFNYNGVLDLEDLNIIGMNLNSTCT